jgi:hypothetical protein
VKGRRKLSRKKYRRKFIGKESPLQKLLKDTTPHPFKMGLCL